MTELPEGRKPLTTMESADLVLRMHKKLEAGFTAGDRIARLEELYEAAKQDAKEAEVYAEELEAKLKSAVEALERIDDASNDYCMTPTYSEGTLRYAHKSTRNLARATLAELKGETDE